MKMLRNICRFFVGLTFTLSGLTKAVDPVGGGFKVNEYLEAFLHFNVGDAANYLAIGLCAVEFVTGVALLCRVKIRVFALVALLLSGFFLIVTYLSAQFNLVKDCGCFGDAAHISAWDTFLKNLLLTLLSLGVFLQRGRYRNYHYKHESWVGILLPLVIVVGIAAYSLIWLPLIDLTDFRPSTDLIARLTEAPQLKYKTEVLYQKEGKIQKFDLKHLPDSTWTFVTTKSTVIEGDEADASKMRLILKDAAGEDVTEQVLNSAVNILFISYYNFSNYSVQGLEELKKLEPSLDKKPFDIYILFASEPKEGDKALPFKVLYADYKTLATFNRADGGLTHVRNGIIQKKSRKL